MQPNFDRLREQARKEGVAYRASLEKQQEPRMYGRKTVIRMNKEYLEGI